MQQALRKPSVPFLLPMYFLMAYCRWISVAKTKTLFKKKSTVYIIIYIVFGKGVFRKK